MRTTPSLLALLAVLLLSAGCCCNQRACCADLPTIGLGVPRDLAEPTPPAQPEPAPWPSAEERTMQEGHAPTPFTAAQLREGLPSGSIRRFQMDRPQGPLMIQTMKFTGSDAEGTEVEMSVTDVDGKPMGTSHRAGKRPWTFFQSHASYPLEHTTITEATIETKAGSFDCFVYRVVRPDSSPNVIDMFWFAREVPGPPVMMRSMAGDELIYTMELIEVIRPEASE